MSINISGIDWVALSSVISSAVIGIISVIHFNGKSVVYEIRKNTILRSLSLVDDYLACELIKNDIKGVIVTKEKTVEKFTEEARICFNELRLTCKNEDLLNTFMQLFYPTKFPDKLSILNVYENYIQLCRKELGLKKLSYEVLHKADIAYIGKIDPKK